MIQVFIVEDHAVVRQMLRALIEREADLAVSGDAATAEEALEALARRVPDLVLIDVSLPGMSGIELARTLHRRLPNLLPVMLSGHAEKRYVEQAFEAGARGYILKGNAEEIPDAIRQVLQGDAYLSTELNLHDSGM